MWTQLATAPGCCPYDMPEVQIPLLEPGTREEGGQVAMPDLSFLGWLSSHEWVFWLTLNTCTYLSHRFYLRHTMFGLLALILPVVVGTTTLIMASEMWIGGIGIGFILLTIIPIFIVVMRQAKESK